MRVALKDIKGVQTVEVSFSTGQAAVTFTDGNDVRYEQLLRAIEKNGFVVKGATLVADGMLLSTGSGFELQIRDSNERLKLEPQSGGVVATRALAGKSVEVTGSIAEVPKGQTAEVIRYTAITER